MKNCLGDKEVAEFIKSNIKKIIDVAGKTNIVFPPYKAIAEELKENYKSFAEALARKNLTGYDKMTRKNKMMIEMYELAVALQNIAEDLLQEIKTTSKRSNFLVAASIL